MPVRHIKIDVPDGDMHEVTISQTGSVLIKVGDNADFVLVLVEAGSISIRTSTDQEEVPIRMI